MIDSKELLKGHVINTPDDEFLSWLIDRLVVEYGESSGTDFVVSLEDRKPLYSAAPQLAREHAEMKELLEEFAERDCAYGDGCPENAGTHHGICVGCQARAILESK